MGVGKTTIGIKLAEKLGKIFADSDREIERHTGASIPLIFEVEGELGFRRREAEMIDELTQRANIVLATGGGAIISAVNRQWLKQRGFVVYLRAPIDQLLARTSKDKNRPLLQNPNPDKILKDLMEKREPYYQEVADLIFDTNKKSVKDIVEQIILEISRF